jgi:hypothetical protein
MSSESNPKLPTGNPQLPTYGGKADRIKHVRRPAGRRDVADEVHLVRRPVPNGAAPTVNAVST